MYKIYINETPLLLVNTSELNTLPKFDGEILKARYSGKAKFLLQYIDMLEKSRRFEAVILYANDEKELFKAFKAHFQIEKAAGGLVFNERKEILFIFRRDNWDLPKGKIDPGEGKKEAALREVREETGVEQLELGKRIMKTYHTFRKKSGKRILKKVYWYKMQTTDSKLVPQAEEDIEIATWMSLDAFFGEKRVVYKNILEVLAQGS